MKKEKDCKVHQLYEVSKDLSKDVHEGILLQKFTKKSRTATVYSVSRVLQIPYKGIKAFSLSKAVQ